MDDLSAELEASQKECRNYNSELFRLRAAWDETVEQLDVVKRENKNLADEIKDLLDQLGDGGRYQHICSEQGLNSKGVTHSYTLPKKSPISNNWGGFFLQKCIVFKL